MRVTIWGCRGSVPTPGPETITYGGNTSCVEVSLDDGRVLVLDAGTGIRPLGFDLLDRGLRKIHLCLTHLHLDHFVDRVSLAAHFVVHPGPTVGYRIETSGSSFAYIPDHEPALAGAIAGRSIDWISGAALASGVDVLVHDAQYFEDEYEERIGWGHSSVADAVEFKRAVGAGKLVLFHHEPRHTDGLLEQLEDRARELAGGNGEPSPTLAREGMVFELP